MIELRPYQLEAVDAVEKAWARGMRRPLLAMATGLGKTICFGELIRRRNLRSVVLVHREELLQQAVQKLLLVWPQAQVGVVRAETDEHEAPVVVASVPTLSRPERLRRVTDPFQVVVVDEAHHATAPTYRRLLGHFDNAMALGVTATPERADKENLSDVWDKIVYRLQLAEAVKQGYLCDLRAVRIQVAVDLDRVRTHDGDWNEADLQRALADAGAPEHAVRAYREQAPGRKAVVFTPGIQLAHEMAEVFDGAGISAAALDESTPREERAAVLRAFRHGDIQVLANCGILTEGYDEPSTDAIIVARPTKSRPLYVQMIGRGTRRHPGKTDCLIIDLVGDSERHDLVTVGDLFEMDLPEGASVMGEFERLEAGPREVGEEVAAGGELVAHRVDLFDSRRFQWACGDGLYVLPAGDSGQVALAESDSGWRVWHLGHDYEHLIAEGLDVEYAQGTAEDLVRHLGGLSLAQRGAAWREQRASEGQLSALRRMGLPGSRTMARGEASEVISLEIARRALQPATARQLHALQARGVSIPGDLTKREASRLLGGGKVA